jgi:GTP:adenosylcobinamide-phosphate guanylyltransferase
VNAVVLAAGRATRLGGACKALIEVGGRPMVDWQRDVLGDPVVVCRREHFNGLNRPGVRPVTHSRDDGPAGALAAALDYLEPGPVVVAFADTWFRTLPAGHNWIGAAAAPWGGRRWDVCDTKGVHNLYARPGTHPLVCIGLYCFSDQALLGRTLARFLPSHVGEVGMAPVINAYSNDRPMHLVPIPDWQDVGDPEAIAHWKHPQEALA